MSFNVGIQRTPKAVRWKNWLAMESPRLQGLRIRNPPRVMTVD